MRLTKYLALFNDPVYHDIVEEVQSDINALNHAFGAVWEKLMTLTNGGSWADNRYCIDAAGLIHV